MKNRSKLFSNPNTSHPRITFSKVLNFTMNFSAYVPWFSLSAIITKLPSIYQNSFYSPRNIPQMLLLRWIILSSIHSILIATCMSFTREDHISVISVPFLEPYTNLYLNRFSIQEMFGNRWIIHRASYFFADNWHKHGHKITLKER